jgi:hypothetical protein
MEEGTFATLCHLQQLGVPFLSFISSSLKIKISGHSEPKARIMLEHSMIGEKTGHASEASLKCSTPVEAGGWYVGSNSLVNTVYQEEKRGPETSRRLYSLCAFW